MFHPLITQKKRADIFGEGDRCRREDGSFFFIEAMAEVKEQREKWESKTVCENYSFLHGKLDGMKKRRMNEAAEKQGIGIVPPENICYVKSKAENINQFMRRILIKVVKKQLFFLK